MREVYCGRPESKSLFAQGVGVVGEADLVAGREAVLGEALGGASAGALGACTLATKGPWTFLMKGSRQIKGKSLPTEMQLVMGRWADLPVSCSTAVMRKKMPTGQMGFLLIKVHMSCVDLVSCLLLACLVGWSSCLELLWPRWLWFCICGSAGRRGTGLEALAVLHTILLSIMHAHPLSVIH